MPISNEQRREQLRKESNALKIEMGNKCSIYGCTNTNLQFDHIYGRAYDLDSGYSIYTIRRYREEWLKGELRLLCSHHNQSFGATKKNKGFRNNFIKNNLNNYEKDFLNIYSRKKNKTPPGIFSEGRGAAGRRVHNLHTESIFTMEKIK